MERPQGLTGGAGRAPLVVAQSDHLPRSIFYRRIATLSRVIVPPPEQITLFGKILGWFVGGFRWLIGLFKGANAPVPTKTLRLVPLTGRLMWSPGSYGTIQGAHAHGTWHVQNVSPNPNTVVKATFTRRCVEVRRRFPYVRLWRQSEKTMLHLSDERKGRGDAATEVDISFFVPDWNHPGRELKGIVRVFDTYGNAHRLRATFKAVGQGQHNLHFDQ